MKTYLKYPYEKPLTTIYYSSSDIQNHFSSSINFQQRIVQPSTKELQRLLSSYYKPCFEHIHSGKYGIKPLWPSDESIREYRQFKRKSSKNRSFSILMASPNYDRGRCLRYKSDLQKTPLLPPTSTVPVATQRHSSLLVWGSVSLLLLLILIIFRRRDDDESNENEINNDQEHVDESLEENIHVREPSEYRLSAARILPTITEENPTTIITPLNSNFKFNPQVTSINTIPASAYDKEKLASNYSDENDRPHSSSTTLRQRKTEIIDDADDFVQIPRIVQEKSYHKHEDISQLADDISVITNESGHPVIFRKLCLPHENAIRDDFSSIEEVNQAVKDVGLVRSQLIFGIDYTISNLETGKHSFNGLSLHHIEEGLLNPYQSVITIVGRTLEKFDSDSLIPAFGFGDRTTLDRKIFPLRPDGTYCTGFRGVLDAYNKITPKVRMSGPTNFAPLIKEAIRIVKKTGQYHILVIVADGQVTNERQTKEAIVEASSYPLSIVMVGVGDGPWDVMNEFDDSLPARQFDNFQFVNYNSVVQATADTDTDFALHALMEIPSQYAEIKRLGLLKDS
ncbi:unnamed protein product [Adineta steineri]|uniref:VWFA domain-containing protein n=1 Tax=Adineta steineri TaxID=433720 RepID=A0A819GIF1_9BILA|nr:unnamed protein product [Adineta steineri]